MKKIPTIFKRDPANPSRVTDEVNPDCFWVFNGEGLPTRKFDGTACMVRDGVLYKRYDCKKGRQPQRSPSSSRGWRVTSVWSGPCGTSSLARYCAGLECRRHDPDPDRRGDQARVAGVG